MPKTRIPARFLAALAAVRNSPIIVTVRCGNKTIGINTDVCAYRGWRDALAGRPSDAAPNYVRKDPVLWSLYMYGYRAAKEALS